MKKDRIVCILLLMLLSAVPLNVRAGSLPDMNRTGAITVSMQKNGSAVSGGSLTLFQVGQIQMDDGNCSFVPTDAFKAIGQAIEDVQSPETASKLAKLAENEAGTTKKIGKDGKVTFNNLKPGLYLIVQREAAPGYEKIKPFLVSIPFLQDGKAYYQVDASVKTELQQHPHTIPPKQPGNKLPQTGQLWWPVPVLAAAGALCLLIGILRRRGERNGN